MKKAGFRRKAAPQCLHLLLRTLECLFGVRGWSVLFSHGWVDAVETETHVSSGVSDLSVHIMYVRTVRTAVHVSSYVAT